MTSFLLILSLILNFVALFAIIILYLRQNRLNDVEKKQEIMIREMEEVIASYLVQMKEENDQFLNRIKKVDVQPNVATNKVSREKATIREAVSDSLIDNQPKAPTGKIPVKKAASVYQKNAKTRTEDLITNDKIELPPIAISQDQTENIDFIKKPEDNSGLQELSLLSQVLSLQKQGYSEEGIAKKLNKGKTEIALLLKFNQNL